MFLGFPEQVEAGLFRQVPRLHRYVWNETAVINVDMVQNANTQSKRLHYTKNGAQGFEKVLFAVKHTEEWLLCFILPFVIAMLLVILAAPPALSRLKTFSLYGSDGAK